jgi:phage repressor protein C with HTH and peptisase S24 domain
MTGTFVKEKINEAGFSLADVANKLEVSPQTLQSRLKADDIKVDSLRSIAKAINKSLYYFLNDDELPAYQQAKTFSDVAEKKIDSQSIPLYNIEASAGLVPLFRNSDEHIIDYINIPNLPNCDGAVYVTGDSMYPLLKSGDIVLYKQIKDIKNNIFWGEMYLISVDMDGEEYISVKYVQRSDEGKEFIRLVSQNQHHQPKDIHLKRVRALAIVKASVRMNAMR